MNYKIAARYDDYVSAHVALGLLEHNNINCWLKDENTVTIDPILTNAVGGIKLMVAEPQLDRALKILEERKTAYQQQHLCPNCGSSNIEVVSTPRKAGNWLTAFAGFILGSYAIGSEKVYHCFACDHEFDMD